MICYQCKDGLLVSQQFSGETCPSGWSTNTLDCTSQKNPSSSCTIDFTENCLSDGSLEITISVGGGLQNVQVQHSGIETQYSTCGPVVGPINITGSIGSTINVVGYCGTPYILETHRDDSPEETPIWGVEDCGHSALADDTTIIAFYDNTSLGATAKTTTYNAIKDWVDSLGSSFSGNVYHIQIGGESWVSWLTYCMDQGIDPATYLGGATVAPTVLPDWNSDPNPYTGGSNGSTISLPTTTNSDNILCLVFADESERPPASGELYHQAGTLTGLITDWQMAADTDGTPTDTWKVHYDKYITTYNNFNTGSGSFKAFIYPSEPDTVYLAHRPFPLHVLGAIESGDSNPEDGILSVAPICNLDGGTDLSAITLSNPYYAENNLTHGAGHTYGYGGLDHYGVGYNVTMDPMTSAQFAIDLNAFLSVGSTSCGGTDCAKILLTDEAGNPLANKEVSIGGIISITDASGYSPMYTGLSGSTLINGCNPYNFLGDCTQYLFQVILVEESFTPTQKCILGCTDSTAINYEPTATVDDGSCRYCVYGCTNPFALNYDPNATCDDGTCKELPDVLECTLTKMSKELLKECETECGDPDKAAKMRADIRMIESVLAQVYSIIDCGRPASELTKLMPFIDRLITMYNCDACYDYNPNIDNSKAVTTKPFDCGAEFSGECDNKIVTFGRNTRSAEYTISGSPQVSFCEDALPGNATREIDGNIRVDLGNIAGKTVSGSTICDPVDIIKQIEACGLTDLPSETAIFAFYDVTSTCAADIQTIYTTLDDWAANDAPAGWTGQVYHVPVHGEKWVACGRYPFETSLDANKLSLCNGPNGDLGGTNVGYDAGFYVNGTFPKLPAGGDYTDQGDAGFTTPFTKAVVLCFFDEAHGSQGGGAYHDRNVNVTSHSSTPALDGTADDWGTISPTSSWIEDHDNHVAVYANYEFFRGFLYPVITGCYTNCGDPMPKNEGECYVHTAKAAFVLHSLAGIHSGPWDIGVDGLVPVNPAFQQNGISLDAITLPNNPYFDAGYDGLDQYGWSIDATAGSQTNTISSVFNSGQFVIALNNLLDTEEVCNGTDCYTVTVKDFDNPSAIIATVPLTTVSPGSHAITIPGQPDPCYTLETKGECTQYDITFYKKSFTYDDCVVVSSIGCGCDGESSPGFVISIGAAGTIAAVDGVYGYIENETTGTTITFEEDPQNPLVGPDLFFAVGDKNVPDGRYKIVMHDINGAAYEACLLSLCTTYVCLRESYKDFTTSIECCNDCEAPYNSFLKAYTIYRALKVTGIDCGMEAYIDKNIKIMQEACAAGGSDSACKNC